MHVVAQEEADVRRDGAQVREGQVIGGEVGVVVPDPVRRRNGALGGISGDEERVFRGGVAHVVDLDFQNLAGAVEGDDRGLVHE